MACVTNDQSYTPPTLDGAMNIVTITPLPGCNNHGLPPVTLHSPKPSELSDIIRSYVSNGVPYKLVYSKPQHSNPIAPSFVSR